MRKLAIDVDGVLANFTDAYASALTKVSGIEFPKASDDFPTEWNWEIPGGCSPEQVSQVWNDHILNNKTFWSLLHPCEGAGSAIYRLNRMAQQGDEVCFITNRPGIQSKYQTEKFLYRLGMNYPTVLVAADKLPLLKAMAIEFFIDDRPETIQEVAADATIPHVYLKDTPYNRTQIYPFNVKRIGTLFEALEECYGA
jgi:hypothetical protein